MSFRNLRGCRADFIAIGIYMNRYLSYLLGGAELERAESRLQVRHRVLEVVERLGDLLLELARVGVRGRVVGDLVGGHGDGW